MDNQSYKVLLIEDNPGDARLIRELLADATHASFELEFANRLTAGLQRLSGGGIDVVLLDLTLPECRGLNTFRRAFAHAPEIPFVVLTGLNDETLAMSAVQEGAEDYLVKGQVDSNSLVRSMHYAIERTRRRRAEDMVTAAKQEFHLARQIQQKLFPNVAPTLAGYDIGGASIPTEATGGDYFDYIPMREGYLGVVIGDVSGHGIGPALLMAETRAYLRALALTHTDVGIILGLANPFLLADTEGGRFVTLFFGRIDPRDHSFVYSSAGHLTSYIFDVTGKLKTYLPSTALPLGIKEGEDFPVSAPLTLIPGDVLFLLTDGIIEACDRNERAFGIERALDVVRNNLHKKAREIVEGLYQDVLTFSAGKSPIDDVTAVVIKFTGLP